jgi:hypothetical protein
MYQWPSGSDDNSLRFINRVCSDCLTIWLLLASPMLELKLAPAQREEIKNPDDTVRAVLYRIR